MDHPDTTTTGTDAGTPSTAEPAVNLERMADQLAAMPVPPRANLSPPPASAFGDQGAADAAASFYTSYAQTAASLAADHDALIGHLRAAATAYRTGDAEAAEKIMLAGIANLTAGDLPAPRTPPE